MAKRRESEIRTEIDFSIGGESFFFQNHPDINDYIAGRLALATSKQPDQFGCIIGSRKTGQDTRQLGYCQLKLRFHKKQASPHHYKVAYFLKHKQLPPDGMVGSHLCERGACGCIGHNGHVIYEVLDHTRRYCHKTTKCPNCKSTHFAIEECEHNPICIRTDAWLTYNPNSTSDDENADVNGSDADE